MESHTEYVRDTSRGMGHARRYAFTSAVIRRRKTGRKRLVHMKLCTWVLGPLHACMPFPLPFIPVGFRAAEGAFYERGDFHSWHDELQRQRADMDGARHVGMYARCHCGCLEDGNVALCPRCLQTCLNVGRGMHCIYTYDELQYLKIAE